MDKKKRTTEKNEEKQLTCGIIMPISSIDGCSEEHWIEVRKIIEEALNDSKFEVNLVSDSDETNVIQKNIIHNIYNSDIVICDVSAKNSNVMFELGLRLGFDKPTIIIKDDQTDYSFDTSIIEHLMYPRDLHYHKIKEFKNNLKNKVIFTHKKATTDKNYTTFLKHFDNYKVAKLEETEVTSQEYLINVINELKDEIRFISKIEKKNITDISILQITKIANTLKKFTAEYIVKKNIHKEALVFFKEDFIKYLESQEEVMKYCKSINILRQSVDTMIFNSY